MTPTAPEAAVLAAEQAIAAHFAAGRWAEALAAATTLIERAPSHSFGWKAQGAALWRLGQPARACSSLERATALSPEDPAIPNLLGLALAAQGQAEAALAHFDQALTLAPGLADAYSNRGIALQALGRTEDAVASLEHAILLDPQHADAHYNLACLLVQQGRLEPAQAHFERTLALNPAAPAAHHNLGALLASQGRLETALAHYRRALALVPGMAEAHNSLGNLLADIGHFEAALKHYDQALALRPGYASAASNRLFVLASNPACPLATCRAQAAAWEQQCLDQKTLARAADWRFNPAPLAGRRLRLGVVSAELGHHAVAHFLLPALAALDRTRIALTLYPTVPRHDAITADFRALAETWTPLWGCDDPSAVARIRADSIDILLDTSGHTAGNRLGIFAHRAAPVQCHYIGWFATTGLSSMDYFLADAVLVPPAFDAQFTEQIWRLPRVWQAYAPLGDAPAPTWRPSSDGTCWVGSFTNLAKVNETTLALWARVLHALPEGRLLLKDDKAGDRLMRERILNTLMTYDIGAERIHFLARDPSWSAHMARYGQLDVALDTLTHNSCTTAFDALWMGVPFITLAGDRLGGRMGAAILSAMGRPDWIAESETGFVSTAVALARDLSARQALRTTLRAQLRHSPLCDAAGLARALETAFTQMIERYWRPCGVTDQNG